MRRASLALLAITFTATIVPVFKAGAASPNSVAKPLSVCTDKNGTRRVADLDVVLLMDNSKSLETTKKGARPTDKDGLRFRAVRDLLVSLEGLRDGSGGQKGVPINFGMISFGSRAQVEIPIGPLDDADALAKEVESTLPPLQQVTDYIGALEVALNELATRPTENCKFLVWFTDGQFESSEVGRNDPDRAKEIAKQAARLEREVCEQGGLADRFHDERINTFVLVLRPTTSDERLDVSYGAMQAITGAFGEGKVPDDVAKGKRGDLCGNIESRDHLGDILVAEDASSIARKVPTIANSIDEWQPVTACPVSSDEEDMPRMPAARHLAKLSFTAYEKGTKLTSLDGAVISDNSGVSRPFADFLEKDSASEFERKYRFSRAAVTELDQGWTFSVPDGEVGWCVQMLPHDFEVEFTTDPAEPVREVVPGGLLTGRDLARLTYATKSGVGIESLDAARSETEEVIGFLDIDPTKVLFAEPLPVAVRQLTVPQVSCERIAITAAEPMPKNRSRSAGCDIDTSSTTLGTVTLKVVSGEALGDEKCSATLSLASVPRGEEFDPRQPSVDTIRHDKGAATILVVLTAEGRSARCVSSDGNFLVVDFSSGGSAEPIKIPVIIDVNWRKVPNPWIVALVTGLVLLLVLLVNLGVMRFMNRAASRIPRFGVDAYEVPVVLSRDSSGRVTLALRDMAPVSSFVFDLGAKISVEVDGDRRGAVLRGGSGARLKVKSPPLHRPFGESAMSIESKKSARYWEAVAGESGLSPTAGSGAIVHSPRPVGDRVEALVTVLLPGHGTDRQRFIRDILATRLVGVVQDTSSDKDWFGAVDAGSVGARPTTSVPSPSQGPTDSVSREDEPPRPPQPPPRAR